MKIEVGASPAFFFKKFFFNNGGQDCDFASPNAPLMKESNYGDVSDICS